MGPWRATACCLAVAMAAAGCGRAPEEPMFPLEAGRWWSYNATTVLEDATLAPQRERLVLRAEGQARVEGQPAWLRRSDSGTAWYLRGDATGVFRVASSGPLHDGPVPDAAPRYVLKRPYVEGTAWEAPTVPYVLQRRNEFPRELRHLARYRQLTMRYRITATGRGVDVPAGRFEDCVEVEGIAQIRLYADEVLDWREVPLVTREWYCPGVGLVKQERIEHSPTRFILGGTHTLELADWR